MHVQHVKLAAFVCMQVVTSEQIHVALVYNRRMVRYWAWMFHAFWTFGFDQLPFAIFLLVLRLHIKVINVNQIKHPQIVKSSFSDIMASKNVKSVIN